MSSGMGPSSSVKSIRWVYFASIYYWYLLCTYYIIYRYVILHFRCVCTYSCVRCATSGDSNLLRLAYLYFVSILPPILKSLSFRSKFEECLSYLYLNIITYQCYSVSYSYNYLVPTSYIVLNLSLLIHCSSVM